MKWLLGRLFGRADTAEEAPRFPQSYNLDDPVHCLLLDEVREKYAQLLADESHEYAACMYRPAGLLPYRREVIRTAFDTLIDWAEGRRSSSVLDRSELNADVVRALRASLAYLDDYLDLSRDELPCEPVENLMAVQRLRREGRLPERKQASPAAT